MAMVSPVRMTVVGTPALETIDQRQRRKCGASRQDGISASEDERLGCHAPRHHLVEHPGRCNAPLARDQYQHAIDIALAK
jgi:hypothetical protein